MRLEFHGKHYVDQKSFAAMLGRSQKCVAAWRARGYGPAYYRLGGRVMYCMDDIAAFISGTKIEAL